MLEDSQLTQIREILERSQNPLFFYDNDADGLCAFLILKRSLSRGKGVAIKSFPDLNQQYNHKLEELTPDLIVILDKAELSQKFTNHAEHLGIPILWIDHHETKTSPEIIKQTSYFSSLPTAEPTSYIAQKIFNRQEDLWLSIIGCIADVYMPSFAKKISEQFPELLPKISDPFTALQSTDLGKIARMLNFGLMDTTTNILKITNHLTKCNSPHDILEENAQTKQLHKKFKELSAFLNTQIEKAEKNLNPNSQLLFFTYSGQTSMSSEIANRLYFLYPDKTIITAFLRPEKANISIRGKNALKITKQLIKNIPEATGGGHTEATGAMVPIDQFEKFKQNTNSIP